MCAEVSVRDRIFKKKMNLRLCKQLLDHQGCLQCSVDALCTPTQRFAPLTLHFQRTERTIVSSLPLFLGRCHSVGILASRLIYPLMKSTTNLTIPNAPCLEPTSPCCITLFLFGGHVLVMDTTINRRAMNGVSVMHVLWGKIPGL